MPQESDGISHLMQVIEKAFSIAIKVHAGQKDKAGRPYLLHPLRVMAKMPSEREMAVAVLHDVIEDSDYTPERLLEEGIPGEIVESVEALTRKPGETYSGFIDRLICDPVARRVKLADIEDNINILRLHRLTEKDFRRLKKYHTAWWKIKRADADSNPSD